LQTSKRWLAKFNQLSATNDAWRVRAVRSSAQLLKISRNTQILFSVIEIDRDTLSQRLPEVRQLCQSASDFGKQQAVAIVGNGVLRQDDFADDANRSSRESTGTNKRLPATIERSTLKHATIEGHTVEGQAVEIERLCRAAGAVHCCWSFDRLERLIQIINQFAIRLPAQDMRIQEYIQSRLPWQGPKRQ